MSKRKRFLKVVVAVFIVGAGANARAATVHDEVVNGDLSGDRFNPTPLAVALGSNTVLATSVRDDLEYFRFTVPPGRALTAINVNRATALAFIAVQRGTQFTEPPTGTVTSQLLGYAHFGPVSATDTPENILDDIGAAPGTIRFTGPLPAGDYVFWAQETALTPTSYTLDFQISNVPVPAPMQRSFVMAMALGLLGIGLGFATATRRALRSSFGRDLRRL